MLSNTLRLKWWVYEALLDTKTKVFFATGGLGAGKTDGGCTWHYDRVVKNKNAQFSWFFEPTYKKVEDAAIPTYKEVLGRVGLRPGKHYKIKKSPNYSFTFFATGQEVHFLSYDRPDLIVATEISHAFLDEAFDADQLAYMNIRSRIRDTQAVIRQLMCAGAPQGVNWGAEIADSDTLQGWDRRVERDHIEPIKGYRRFTLWTDDNIDNLPEDYIQILEDTYGHNPGLIQSYRFGRFCPLTQRAAYSNYRQYNDIDDIEPSPQRDLILTFDFNANPVSWVSLQRIPFNEGDRRIFKWVGLKESTNEATQLADACVEFAVKHPVEFFRRTPIKLYGDRSGHAKSHKIDGSDYDNVKRYLNELGYQNVEIVAARQVAPESESVDSVQKLLMNNLLVIVKSLSGLRKSWLATEWQEGVRKLHKPKNDTWTHKSDAVKYFVYQECREETGQQVTKIYGTNNF